MLMLLTRREHSTLRKRKQFRAIDAVSLLVLLSLSFAIVSAALRHPAIASPVDLVSRIIAGNIWLLPIVSATFWLISTRELESLAVQDSIKRVLFVCLVLPCVAAFAVAISMAILVVFQSIVLPAGYPSPIPLALLAIPAAVVLRRIGNWCLLPPATAVVEYVE